MKLQPGLTPSPNMRVTGIEDRFRRVTGCVTSSHKMADGYGKGGGKHRRKGGKKGEAAADWDYDGYGKGYSVNHNPSSMGGKPSKDIVHHYPPKDMAADVGYPVRGGQTLLIAYFPWEASEADIEREFSKFCRVKRVHLVVDKSSRKPRCFGFVKFLSKADAEEALRATTQGQAGSVPKLGDVEAPDAAGKSHESVLIQLAGLVQLPDTRGHVWHLKAEWTKSGDMVVDDSEAEQEVAKRKEERRSRTDTGGSPGASVPPPKARHATKPKRHGMAFQTSVRSAERDRSAVPMATETLKISDGSSMEITRLPDLDDETWQEVKAYVEGNPETAKALQNFAKNPDAMRGWLQTQAIAEHYNSKLSHGDTPVQEKVKSLESDPELAPIFEDIKKNGMEAAMKYYQDEEIMLKISQKMGGLPSELSPVLQKIEDRAATVRWSEADRSTGLPTLHRDRKRDVLGRQRGCFYWHPWCIPKQDTAMTLHEAAKRGDLNAVKTFLDKKKPLDSQDFKGITALGYAIGANRIAVVKLLLDSRANPYSVDASGNSGLHYAAGYGRKELLDAWQTRSQSRRRASAADLPPGVLFNASSQKDVALETLKKLAGAAPMRLGEKRPVQILETLQQEETLGAVETNELGEGLQELESALTDPMQKMMLLQMKQLALLTQQAQPKGSDPLSSVLGGSETSGGASGIKGCLAREAYVKLAADLTKIAPVIQSNAAEELGLDPHQVGSGLMRDYLERRCPLGDNKILTQIGYLFAAGWEQGFKTNNPELMGFAAKGMLYFRTSAWRPASKRSIHPFPDPRAARAEEYLLKVGANVNQPNAEGLTPLGAATQNRKEATMAAHGAHAVPPLQQPLPPQGQLYGQHMYGQGQQLYGSQASIYGGGLPVPGRDPARGARGTGRDAVTDGDGMEQVMLEMGSQDLEKFGSYAAAVAAHHAPGYPPQSQSYVGQQPYGGQPYVSSQQAAYSAGQYSGQQAAYAAGQQAYQTAAATASSGYGTAYPPQAASTYGAPPGYGAPYGQQAATYPANPTAYATAGYGLGQSPYNYLQQPAGAGGASGVVAYGSYQGAQSQVPQTQQAQPLQYTQPQAAPADERAVTNATLGSKLWVHEVRDL
eukprot:g17562.t1